MGKKNTITNQLNVLRTQIQKVQVILIVSITLFSSIGGFFIYLNSYNKTIHQNLQNFSELITRIYQLSSHYTQEQLISYMDKLVLDIPEIDVVSIVDQNQNRIYHTTHNLINTKYEGKIPDFSKASSKHITESSIGPSGPQLRTYSPVYNKTGNFCGFIMTIRLKSSIKNTMFRTILLFLIITIIAILIEISISKVLSKKIKHEFISFTEDFEGTKFLVDSMRANNHDFTNKLHVILGLIQIGQYSKAVEYIQNISIIQKETLSKVMNSIHNPSFAALIIGKIARASECNVKFILQENSCFIQEHIQLPSEALVTITGNLIDNALDAMNLDTSSSPKTKELIFGVYTTPGKFLMTIKDSGPGIPIDIQERIFDNGFSTKGTNRGIGLYHTKNLVQSLGGHISFETQKDKGTCFMVKLDRQD